VNAGTPKGEVGVVVGTPGDKMVQQQYQSGFAFVKTVAQANALLQNRSRPNGIDKSADKM